MDLGLLLLRAALGVLIAAHGAQKLFGWFGGFGIEGTGGWLESMGFKPAKLQAAVVGLSEFGGGLLIGAGLLTPLGALAVAGVMFVATISVHWTKGFFNGTGGFEFNFLIYFAAVALAFIGPGRYSLDHAFGWHLAGTEWGLVALLGSVAAGTLVLAMRKPAPQAKAA
ncbi:MAG: putative oxidoreductase [Actinomycetota bacterium]|nr:putative oxidoreductase [Actinomycetota bacterium]